MNEKNTICPVCESGELQEKVGTELFSYKEQQVEIHDYKYSECTLCGAEVITPKQRKANDKILRDKQRCIDGLLIGEDIKLIRKKFNLTQAGAAEIFGGGANAFSKYENGDVIQSAAMDRLLRITNRIPGVFEELVRLFTRDGSIVLKSKHIVHTAQCDYGTCEISTELGGKIVKLSDVRNMTNRKASNEGNKPYAKAYA